MLLTKAKTSIMLAAVIKVKLVKVESYFRIEGKMKKLRVFVGLSFFILIQACAAQSAPEGFVYIKGGTFNSGDVVVSKNRPLVRVGDFEILDHPVTNAEYKAFIDDTGYSAPLHWVGGKIPAGKEKHPVIFVNFKDADKYFRWLTEKDNRIYRFPTSVEFEYASRGGPVDKMYPWGDNKPDKRANFDTDNNRRFDRWQDYLEPVKRGKQNRYGLYDMAGNVWQMVRDDVDAAVSRWIYRFEDTSKSDNIVGGNVMGGSWARGTEYLRCGYKLHFAAGIRNPDLGFRPVRKPEGADWEIQSRKLSAISRGEGQVFLSWALLKNDTRTTRFNIYRTNKRNHAGFLVNEKPVSGSTTFLDTGLEIGQRYNYYVRPVNKQGKEGKRCEWIGITVSEEPSLVVTTFKPVYKRGAVVPIFGDLDGDGVLDCVTRLDNGNHEMSQDAGLPVHLEAFTSYGRPLWRKEVCYHDHCFGSANNVPFNVWDMDGDGKAEVITRLQIGDQVYVAILDGLTGRLKYKTPWPKMVSHFVNSSTRIHLSIAYLDGIRPAVVTQTGLYENEVFVAYDAELSKIWRFNSFGETSGSGGHKIEVADVDGDGRQEVFDGTVCLRPDGTVRWSIYKLHPDIVSIHDYLPDRPGLEVFYIVESSVHAGVYMVDASSGEIIWKVNREDDPRWTHGHYGMTADIWDGSPGIECMSNRAGHNDRNVILFSADGRVLLEPFPYGCTPVELDGDPTRELLTDQGRKIGNFDGKTIIDVPGVHPNPIPDSRLLMVADLYGDFRDELVLLTTTDDGGASVTVVMSAEPINKMFVTPTEVLDYKLWLGRNMGGGYRSIYDQLLMQPKAD